MRLEQILNEGVSPATQKLIKDELRQMAREGNLEVPKFIGRIKFAGSDNLVTVKFMLKSQGPAAGSMSFDNFKGNMDQQDLELETAEAKQLAEELLHRLAQHMRIEDYSIDSNDPGHRPSVNLFMVSDGFIGESISEAKALALPKLKKIEVWEFTDGHGNVTLHTDSEEAAIDYAEWYSEAYGDPADWNRNYEKGKKRAYAIIRPGTRLK